MPCCLCERHTDIKNCNHNKPIQILYLLSNAGRETTERGARDNCVLDGVRHKVVTLDFLFSTKRFLQSRNHPPSRREMGMDSAFSGIM